MTSSTMRENYRAPAAASAAALCLMPSSDERFEHITRLACEIFGVPIARVALAGECRDRNSSPEQAFCERAILHSEPIIVADTLENPDFAGNPLVVGEPHVRFYAGQPILYDGVAVGSLCLIDKVPRQLLPEQALILGSLARWVENELKLAALSEAQSTLLAQLEEARRESYVDPLTKVWNRRGADRILAEEIERARRKQESVALLMIDVDHFKEINDQYGHRAGDQALAETARRLRATMRPYDMIARFGGDELLVFAGNCSGEMAETLALRIYSRIACEPVVSGEHSFLVTLSVGVYVGPAMDLETMLGRADAALYAAKAAGRSCIRFAGPG